uniref:Uncharacterized protein n=1 Tax=Cucumis melo TaxID=3656 RepID=A0A9I9EJS4_CUCME
MPINGISFHLEERVQRWKCVVQRQIADEVNVSHKHHLCLSIIALIVKAGMSKIISNVGPFFPQLIKEFIVNFPSKFNNPSSPDYQTMHIRDSMFKISLAIINDFLGNTVVSDFQSSHPSNDELTYVLFGDSHDLDLEHDMRPSRNPQAFDTDDIDVSSEVDSLVHHLKNLIPSFSVADQAQN